MDRRSGVLMHLSSLPGPFGTGGLGRSAERFADFLKDSGFRVWQVLPTSPVDGSSSYSPYSSRSAFAGSHILISPEKLAEDGFLEMEDVERYHCGGPECIADHGYSTENLKDLIRLSWLRFKSEPGIYGTFSEDYSRFVEKEEYWLRDHALFTVLKKDFEDLSWNRWPKEFATRDKGTLKNYSSQKEKSEEIELICFEQFIFDRQWKAFHRYCLDRDVRLMGDVPMFVAFDSSDVWSNREYFDLDPEGAPNKVAGVPPDYFSANGQRWGNPLYNWETMRRDGFRWWTARFRKALEHFDLIRIDHFRGFSACWAVPAEEETAVNGEWTETPGRKLLEALSENIRKDGMDELPLIAEDLGIITDDVRKLMADFGLPGMKVLLFAFDGEVGSSPYAPHNHIPESVVYTGTHDNNTVRGWWESESDERSRSLVSEYTGREINNENVSEVFSLMALSSTSKLAIIPMQDILGLGCDCRMNVPGVGGGNWLWRMSSSDLDALNRADSHIMVRYKRLNSLFGR
ncbi:MAG: 4-alpha-glucanotransferase [Synergistota bacterium]|nr:4-alpha-glucanotransferase [Synergistota bacterium]